MADIDIEIDITSSQQEQPDIDVHPVYGPKGANGANGRAATIEVGTVRTGAAGTTAIITNSGDSSNAVFNFTIPKGDTGEQGIQGETGATGNGIETIEKTSTSGLVDTYTITYTDDTTSTFTLTNGQNGADGQNGTNATITGATASVDNSTGTPSVVVTAGGSESARSFDFAFSNLKGSKGEQGIQGETGVSVTGVTLLSTVGLDKTYRMTFSDNTYFDYVVSNGAAGSTEWGGITGTLSNQTDLQTELTGLQTQIDAIVSSSDVFDIVGTYAELQAYDISTVPVKDIIKVLVDSTHSNAATYYRCIETGGVKSWSYIGSEGAYYTKSETDTLLNGKYDVSNPSGYITGITSADVTTALGYTPYNSFNPSGYQANVIETIKVNGTAETVTSKAVDITVPTDTNDLTNGAGFITSSALSSYELKNKTINVLSSSGTITLTDNSINTITPSGNVTFTLPTVTDNTVFHQILVQVNMSTVCTINLGLGQFPHYFNKTAPDLSSIGLYNLYFEYDKAEQWWVCGEIVKGAE